MHPAEGEDLRVCHVRFKCDLHPEASEHFCREDALASNSEDEISLRRGALAATRAPDRLNRLWREELCDRRLDLTIWLQGDPDKPARAVALRAFGQIINL